MVIIVVGVKCLLIVWEFYSYKVSNDNVWNRNNVYFGLVVDIYVEV